MKYPFSKLRIQSTENEFNAMKKVAVLDRH